MSNILLLVLRELSGPLAEDRYGPIAAAERAAVEATQARVRNALGCIVVLLLAMMPTPGTTISWKDAPSSHLRKGPPPAATVRRYLDLTYSENLAYPTPEDSQAASRLAPTLKLSTSLGAYSQILITHRLAQ